MVPPTTQSGQAVLEELTNLSRAVKFRAGDFKALKLLQARYKELESLKNASKALKSGLSTASKTTKETKQLYESLRKRTDELTKGVDESKNLWKRFLEKFPNRGGNNNGGGGDGAKAARLGLAVSLLLDAIQVGFTTFMVFRNDEILNYNLASQTANLVASQDAFTRAINAQIQIKNIQERLKVQENDFKEERLKQEVQNNFFKKQFNDLTYEVRKGREKVESQLNQQISNFNEFKNNITYEVREGRRKLESSIAASVNGLKSDFDIKIKGVQNTFDSSISKISGTVQKLSDSIKDQTNINTLLAPINKNIDAISKQIGVAQSTANSAKSVADNALTTAQKAERNSELALGNGVKVVREFVNQISETYKQSFEYQAAEWNRLQRIAQDKILKDFRHQTMIDAQNEAEKAYNDFIDKLRKEGSIFDNKNAVTPQQLKQATDKIDAVSKQSNADSQKIQQLEKQQTEQGKQITNLDSRVVNLEKEVRNPSSNSVAEKKIADLERKIAAAEKRIADIETGRTPVPNSSAEIKKLQSGVSALKKEVEILKPQVQTIDKKLKEREDVDKEANNKLGQILGLVSLIPGIPGKAANLVTPSIPTIPQIEQAAATGTCRTTKPGGCMRKMFDDGVGNINQNVNNNSNKLGNILNGLNTGANAAQLALLTKIDGKLGEQVTGGLSRIIGQITKNQAITQIANLVTMAAAIHNCIQLSDNVAATFFEILDNIFAIPTLIVNPEGEQIDTREVFNGAIENVMKSVFGVQEWAEIKAKWAAFNRIYQAAANSVDEIRSIGSSLSDAISTTATLTGRGFNALQNDGILSDYNWEPTPENLRLKGGIFGKLGKLADGISAAGEVLEAIESVTSEIRSAVESANQIKQNTIEMEEEVKKLLGEETKKRDEDIKAIQAPIFNFEDLF